MPDFTIKALVELYQTLLKCDYRVASVLDFIKGTRKNKICILRHDVDRNIKNALFMARLENQLGLSASYYFRYPKTFDENILKEIINLGHEPGYHYEVLTKAKGDYKEAARIFRVELEEFKKNVSIYTICAHGSPLSKWDDRKLWEKYDFKNFDIIADASLSFDFNDVLYLTDTGRTWNKAIGKIHDKVDTKFNYEFRNTHEIILALSQSKLPSKIMFNIHPNRWSDNAIKWGIELVGQNIKNLFKHFIARNV